MIWSLLFAVGLVQGCFLIWMLAVRKNTGRAAALMLQVILALFALSNLDDLLLATGWYRSVPWLFGWSFGALLALGPLFYLYLRQLSAPALPWRHQNWLHFLPAGLYWVFLLRFLLLPPALKVPVIDAMTGGQVPVQPVQLALAAVQLIHMAIYLGLMWRPVRVLRAYEADQSNASRYEWGLWLFCIFALIFAATLLLFTNDLLRGYYAAGSTYGYTLFTTALAYAAAYRLIFFPDILAPGALRKQYAVTGPEAESLLADLNRCMEERQVFIDPDLKLSTLARQMGVAPYRLSAVINERYRMSFSDFVAHRRVSEFLSRLDDPRYAHLSLHGLALEVGFNSKSAFNAAFKKITGKNPSDFPRVNFSARE